MDNESQADFRQLLEESKAAARLIEEHRLQRQAAEAERDGLRAALIESERERERLATRLEEYRAELRRLAELERPETR